MMKKSVRIAASLVLCAAVMLMHPGKIRARQENDTFWNHLGGLAQRVQTCLLYQLAADQIAQVNEQLRTYIEEYFEDNRIDTDGVAVSIRSLDGMFSYEHNADEPWTAASLYKVPLAILYYDAVADGDMEMTDELYYDSYMYEEGGILALYAIPGTTIQLQELLDDVILYSDNTAGQILLENMGGWFEYKADIEYMGEEHAQFDGYMTWDNLTTANFMSDVMELIARNTDDYEELVENMKASQPENYLNLNNPSYEMIQKYGNIGAVLNASGFTLDGRPYVITVLTETANGEQIIGDISEIAWNLFHALQSA